MVARGWRSVVGAVGAVGRPAPGAGASASPVSLDGARSPARECPLRRQRFAPTFELVTHSFAALALAFFAASVAGLVGTGLGKSACDEASEALAGCGLEAVAVDRATCEGDARRAAECVNGHLRAACEYIRASSSGASAPSNAYSSCLTD